MRIKAIESGEAEWRDTGRVRQEILLAEDYPPVASTLTSLLSRLGVTVRATASPQEARRWLEEAVGELILDGSILRQIGIPLGELPKRVVIWSGDDGLVQDARQLGLRAFCKGNWEEFQALLELWLSRESVTVE